MKINAMLFKTDFLDPFMILWEILEYILIIFIQFLKFFPYPFLLHVSPKSEYFKNKNFTKFFLYCLHMNKCVAFN